MTQSASIPAWTAESIAQKLSDTLERAFGKSGLTLKLEDLRNNDYLFRVIKTHFNLPYQVAADLFLCLMQPGKQPTVGDLQARLTELLAPGASLFDKVTTGQGDKATTDIVRASS